MGHRSDTDKALAQAREEFDRCVESIASNREKQALELAEPLNAYLRCWCNNEKYVSASLGARSSSDMAEAKCLLADHVRYQLKRLHLAIAYADHPAMLYSLANKKCLPGYFVLMAKDSRRALLARSNLSDLLTAATEPNGARYGFRLVEGAIRHESLADWRRRTSSTPRQKGDISR